MSGDNRKSELAELKAQLGLLAGSRAPGAAEARRELFKKVISHMTIGIDVSSVFSEMVICSAGADLVLKKMCYLYVCNYAVMKPELALLTINFLQRDCQDDDPVIRGLALRSLSSLRVKNLVEYLLAPLERGLRDNSGYVRSMAVMAVLKLHHLAAATCHDHEYPEILKTMLTKDPDPQVLANCVYALQEILASDSLESGQPARDRHLLTSKSVIFSLLNRMRELSEWAQCAVLELVVKYVPESQDEVFDIMNLLEDRLQHANSAVVLGAAKVFLHLTLSMPEIHLQVYDRVKTPLLTLMGTCPPEESYAVVSHLCLLVARSPQLFAGEYKHFYCRYSDPPQVKRMKLEMLTAIANDSNKYDIVTELTEYAADVDVSFAREAIRAVGQIALKCYDVNGIVDRLLQFLEMETDYVTAETLVLVKDLLRKYPQWSQDCLAVVGTVSGQSVQEPRAKAALIWMMGEYGEHVDDAPYTLEALAEGWAEDQTPEVRMELLTAAAKLFFKRPPESQKLLGKVLSQGLQDANQDVHDRALLYYRLLKVGPEVAKKVIDPVKQPVSAFADTVASEVKDRIFDEFNTLSVVYGKPAYLFLDKEQRSRLLLESEAAAPLASLPSPGGHPSAASPYSQQDSLLHSSEAPEAAQANRGAPGGSLLGDAAPVANGTSAPSSSLLGFDLLSDAPASSAASSAPPPPPAAPTDLESLLSGPAPPPASTAAAPQAVTEPPRPAAPAAPLSTGSSFLDDVFGLSVPAAAPAQTPSAEPALVYNPRPSLDAPTYQKKWGQFTLADTLSEKLPESFTSALSAPVMLLRHMASKDVQCMASGGQSPNFKFFFYAQTAVAPGGSADSVNTFLVELIVNLASASATAKVKASDHALVPEFVKKFRSALLSFGQL